MTRNDKAGLHRTRESLIRQSNKQFEWIVIDGDSSDGTKEILGSLILPSSASRYISERDGGIYDAMRKGLELAETESILFLNSGDTLESSESIDDIIGGIDDEDIIFFSCRIVSNGYEAVRKPRPLSSAKYSVPSIQQATIYRTEKLRMIEWPIRYQICGDYAIAAQFLKDGCKSKTVDKIISQFELGGVSTTKPLKLLWEAYSVQKDILGLPFSYRLVTIIKRVVRMTGARVIYEFHRRTGGPMT